LWEACSGCETNVRIGTKFCDGCGKDLATLFQQRMDSLKDSLRQAREKAQAFEFEDAIYFASRCVKSPDFRFDELAAKATGLVSQIEKLREAWQAKYAKVLASARKASESEDHARVRALIGKLPAPLRCEELQQMLRDSSAADEELAELVTTLREALRTRDYMVAAVAIDGLLVRRPNEPKFTKAAETIGQSLVASATRQFDLGNYGAALDRLETLPAPARDEKTAAMQRRVQTVEWLLTQFEHPPWVTPALGRMAQRLVKSVPNDADAKELLENVGAFSKRPLPDPRALYRTWGEEVPTWMGAPPRILGFPQHVEGLTEGTGEGSARERLAQHPAEFAQAIGLALQGLGKSFFSDALYCKETKGLKKLFQRKSTTECIGVDAGNTAFRAVKMRLTEKGVPEVVEIWHHAFQQPLCRAGAKMDQAVLQETDLLELKDWIGESEAPLWINQPAREVLGKFVEMPPVKNKDFVPMLEKEVASSFPLAANELHVARWYDPAETDRPRRVIIVGAKSTFVEQRLGKFREVGLEPAGLQCEQVALANFAMHEFADTLATDGDESDSNVETAKSGGLPAIALVDSGASGASLLLLTTKGFLFRSIDGGGEDLTAALARSAKVTLDQAEQLKRDPAMVPSPAEHLAAVEERIQGTRGRMKRIYEEAEKLLGALDVQQVWCVGGTSLMHGWVQRVLMENVVSEEEDDNDESLG